MPPRPVGSRFTRVSFVNLAVAFFHVGVEVSYLPVNPARPQATRSWVGEWRWSRPPLVPRALATRPVTSDVDGSAGRFCRDLRLERRSADVAGSLSPSQATAPGDQPETEEAGVANLDFDRLAWRRSRRSVNASDCVEMAADRRWVGVRDSKDQSGPVVVVAVDHWRDFMSGVRAGEFDLK